MKTIDNACNCAKPSLGNSTVLYCTVQYVIEATDRLREKILRSSFSLQLRTHYIYAYRLINNNLKKFRSTQTTNYTKGLSKNISCFVVFIVECFSFSSTNGAN